VGPYLALRILEHRRHGRQDPTGIHLTADGAALARRVGATLGRFERVVTSSLLRAQETAAALGLSVDRTIEELGTIPEVVIARLAETRPQTFAQYAELVRQSDPVREFARAQLLLWESILSGVPDGGRALIVSHRGVIELGVSLAAPQTVESWGPPLGYLEGIRLGWDPNRWTAAEVLRVDP
jgi:broad specificity phosphatase PhoE